MDEVVRGVRVIKYGAWEQWFASKLRALRKSEVRCLMRSGVLEAVNNAVFFLVYSVLNLVTFSAYTLLFDNTLTPELSFVAIALFNIITRALIMLPRSVKAAAEALVALRRLNHFFGLPEVSRSQVQDLSVDTSEAAISLDSATFAWSTDEEAKTALRQITLTVLRGNRVAVVGKVGSGKSAFLAALLGELTLREGTCAVRGLTALAGQVPWIVSGTLRENVMLAVEEEHRDAKAEERYQAVLDACKLRQDMGQLPKMDETEIGERGVNLSGGQRARVALARACMVASDVVLLDDPLSAVDSAVARHLMDNVLARDGILSESTVVLVTHRMESLELADLVVALDEGEIAFHGSFDEFKKSPVYETLREHDVHMQDKNPEKKRSSIGDNYLVESLVETLGSEDASSEDSKSFKHDGSLVEAEDRQLGRVSRSIYAEFVNAAGGWIVAVAVLGVFSTGQAARNVSDFWIASWSTDSLDRIARGGSLIGNRFYSIVFTGLALATFLFVMMRTVLFVILFRHAARVLHDRLLDSVLRAKQEFFDTNPAGRILNRFSKDMDQMDDLLPITAVDFCQVMFLALGAIATISVIVPWLLVLLVPVSILFFGVQRIYVRSSREIKRLDGVSRSPIYSQFSETLLGLMTVRAMRLQERFRSRFCDRIDTNHEAYWGFVNSARWLAVRLDFLAAVVVFSTSFLVIILRSSIDAGFAGLAITQSMLITSIFQWGVRQAAETENLFTSVERVITTVKETSLEPDSRCQTTHLPEAWPSKGVVEFQDVTMRYRQGLPFALHNVSFCTAENEKLGIVGRTGAGKSSIATSLFRMVELESGRILIDHVDISTVPLDVLRRAMAIVPQDPILFTGTIRENVDPACCVTDSEVWSALRRTGFTKIKPLPEGLDTHIGDGGQNFSVGERQLLCLSRALVADARIIVLDEATAAVDNRTDSVMQRAIRDVFAGCTVITVAHRLQTVAEHDRVMVMERGRVKTVIRGTRSTN
eukprot:Plantae.Rhodophyta-Rhodochaete_pulchella.ctg33817.p1 GENE.Plantae.Rhodophyta-Rhodochaete_pulchella.ctg33817~~Plantae.Rhodophyta-Rhodochaete_pulchella.ctg33817.p1  ORF type:complete len:1034 (+),score=165.34 Plantae.Rhodophyta-Rhodochaete_pulchella.ctg33817:132-3104(+)